MFRIFVLWGMALGVVLFGITNGVVNAEPIEVNAVGEYDVGGNDTREHAKSAAYDNAKRNALEQVAVNVESRTNVSMGAVTRDDILSYAKGRLRIIGSPIYEFTNNGNLCRVYIKAMVDVDFEELKNSKTSFNDSNENISNINRNQNKAKSNVLNGATEWNGHYYKIFNMPLDWETANTFCKKIGGHLATAETEEENEKIKEIFMDEDQLERCWIGGKRNNKKIWQWVTGKTMVEYFDWKNGKPRPTLQLGGPYLSIWKRYNGQWDNLQKRQKYPFMCEWESADDAHDSDM